MLFLAISGKFTNLNNYFGLLQCYPTEHPLTLREKKMKRSKTKW